MAKNKFLNFLFFKRESGLKKPVFKSIKGRADFKRTHAEKIADWTTIGFGSMTFLFGNIIFFFAWIFINTGHISAIHAFDPFPFNLLTMIVSLEAIILSIFVLISQNRNSKVEDLREETHLQLNVISEKEITKLIKMVSLLMKKEGLDLSNDPELKKMVQPVSEEEIEKKLEEEIF